MEYFAFIALDNLLQENKIHREIREIEEDQRHDLRIRAPEGSQGKAEKV